ncbi:HERV-H LTR-associating protein 1 homolog [Engraulis encrasicolus]|uniref:HERV-H LTR-associating protein 1 homolog n=1 Tax=Engraulis encrasicolus TaxID=184585 RepID=UPI002FD27495
MGNSTSYLQELFKSSSILSVNQKNSSDCTYICVMAGKSEKELDELWNLDLITPLFNQTIPEDNPKASSTSFVTMTTSTTTTTTTLRETTKASHTDRPGCPWRAELTFVAGVSREDLKESSLSQDAQRGEDLRESTLSVWKLQPCVFELCKFYNQCLCRIHTYSRLQLCDGIDSMAS